MRHRRIRESDIIDADEAGLVQERVSDPAAGAVPSVSEQAEARRSAISADADTALVPTGERPLYGSQAFFDRAADELLASTQLGQELAGACFSKPRGGRTLLVGMSRRMAGQPGRVAIDPSWGGVLWHTHPGLRGSLAAFSNEDLDVARQANKPLLVIGFHGLSLDVLSTLAMPFGLRAFLASAGIKGLLALEKSGRLPARLLQLGVAARVCYPSGAIQPVLRADATPLQAAVDEMSFTLDKGVGAVERAGQRAVRRVLGLFFGEDGR